MKKYIVIGGKWFDKINGNTYHTAKIIDTDTDAVYYSRFQYGYGSSYLSSAREYIKEVLQISDFSLVDAGGFYIKKCDAKNGNF